MEPARLSAWKGYFISSTITGAAQAILKSELCTYNLCGKNKIPDMNNVLMALQPVWTFFIYLKNFFKKFGEFSTFYLSPIGILGERENYFTLSHLDAEGGELLWSNLLPRKSRQ